LSNNGISRYKKREVVERWKCNHKNLSTKKPHHCFWIHHSFSFCILLKGYTIMPLQNFQKKCWFERQQFFLHVYHIHLDNSIAICFINCAESSSFEIANAKSSSFESWDCQCQVIIIIWVLRSSMPSHDHLRLTMPSHYHSRLTMPSHYNLRLTKPSHYHLFHLIFEAEVSV
jgi:hypothetical protein